MSKDDIYGHVPTKGEEGPIKEAMSDLKESTSNGINGKVDDKRDSNYPEEG